MLCCLLTWSFIDTFRLHLREKVIVKEAGSVYAGQDSLVTCVIHVWKVTITTQRRMIASVSIANLNQNFHSCRSFLLYYSTCLFYLPHLSLRHLLLLFISSLSVCLLFCQFVCLLFANLFVLWFLYYVCSTSLSRSLCTKLHWPRPSLLWCVQRWLEWIIRWLPR